MKTLISFIKCFSALIRRNKYKPEQKDDFAAAGLLLSGNKRSKNACADRSATCNVFDG